MTGQIWNVIRISNITLPQQRGLIRDYMGNINVSADGDWEWGGLAEGERVLYVGRMHAVLGLKLSLSPIFLTPLIAACLAVLIWPQSSGGLLLELVFLQSIPAMVIFLLTKHSVIAITDKKVVYRLGSESLRLTKEIPSQKSA